MYQLFKQKETTVA